MENQINPNDILVQTLFHTLELRNRETAGHCERVTMLALNLGKSLGLAEQDLILLRMGALLHDIGKIGISDSILLKPGSLTDEEWLIMKQHPLLGANLLRPIFGMQYVVPILLSHHEKWDGTGYPDLLVGEKIPYLARICAITEAFDNLVSDFAYRPGLPLPQALYMIQQDSGKAFDPSIVQVFLRMMGYSQS